jgi:hypothetical protein
LVEVPQGLKPCTRDRLYRSVKTLRHPNLAVYCYSKSLLKIAYLLPPKAFSDSSNVSGRGNDFEGRQLRAEGWFSL